MLDLKWLNSYNFYKLFIKFFNNFLLVYAMFYFFLTDLCEVRNYSFVINKITITLHEKSSDADNDEKTTNSETLHLTDFLFNYT